MVIYESSTAMENGDCRGTANDVADMARDCVYTWERMAIWSGDSMEKGTADGRTEMVNAGDR